MRTCVHIVLLLPESLLDPRFLPLYLFDIQDIHHLVINVFKLKLQSQQHLLLIAYALFLLQIWPSFAMLTRACF